MTTYTARTQSDFIRAMIALGYTGYAHLAQLWYRLRDGEMVVYESEEWHETP